MKKVSLFVLVISSLCLCMMSATTVGASPNLIVNGSFEEGDYTNIVDGYPADFVRLGNGSTAITGWVVGGYGLDWHVLDGEHAHFGPGLAGSHFAVDLSLDDSPAGTISQTFATTPGTHYQLSFLLGAPWFDSAVQASVAGVSETFSLSGAEDNYYFPWVLETLNFTAMESSTTLLFESISGGFWGPVLDNVSVVEAVPEPSTMLLLGLGLLGVVGMGIKNRK